MQRLVTGTFAILAVSLAVGAAPQTRQFSKQVASLLSVNAPVVAITHATLIDGTGAPARSDQTVVFTDGKITAVGAHGQRCRSRWSSRHRCHRSHGDARHRRSSRPHVLRLAGGRIDAADAL